MSIVVTDACFNAVASCLWEHGDRDGAGVMVRIDVCAGAMSYAWSEVRWGAWQVDCERGGTQCKVTFGWSYWYNFGIRNDVFSCGK